MKSNKDNKEKCNEDRDDETAKVIEDRLTMFLSYCLSIPQFVVP